jgi:hypothetical protein
VGLAHAKHGEAEYNRTIARQGGKVRITPEQLKDMYLKNTTEELEVMLISCEDTIKELRSYGRAWALDCREMQIAQHNSSYIHAELRRRKTEDK